MKKKISVKLTISLVSLFIGVIFLILGNKNAYCLSFGLICLGVAIGVYALNKSDSFDQILRELMEEREQAKLDDIFLHKEINRMEKKIKKQKRFMSFSFFVCAFLLIVIAFVNIV